MYVFSGPQSVDLCQVTDTGTEVTKPDDKEVDKKINSIFQESKYMYMWMRMIMIMMMRTRMKKCGKILTESKVWMIKRQQNTKTCSTFYCFSYYIYKQLYCQVVYS